MMAQTMFPNATKPQDRLLLLHALWLSYQDYTNLFKNARQRSFKKALRRMDAAQLETEKEYLEKMITQKQAHHRENETYTEESISEICENIERLFDG